MNTSDLITPKEAAKHFPLRPSGKHVSPQYVRSCMKRTEGVRLQYVFDQVENRYYTSKQWIEEFFNSMTQNIQNNTEIVIAEHTRESVRKLEGYGLTVG